VKVVAIIGTYRKGGVVDMAVDEILASAQTQGADTEKIYLIDRRVEFCTNCRTCTQQPGEKRGECAVHDEMGAILDTIEAADALVIGSPMNFWTVTAVTKRFIERLVCYAYWPWGMPAPKPRTTRTEKPAVIVASSAAPAIMARTLTKMIKLLKSVAKLLGAKTIGVLFVGFAAGEQHPVLKDRVKKKARALGMRLVAASANQQNAGRV